MPMTAAALSAMAIRRRAPWAAMETWSSWLAEVGMNRRWPIGPLLVLADQAAA